MRSALIGYTGFVGLNIAKQFKFNDGYNSQNIDQIQDKKYDLIVSAGTRAERWKANADPKQDWLGIKKLLDCLKDVKANHFILISTVDVYPNPVGVDEDTVIDATKLTQAYGFNRYRMEEFVKKNFPKVTIIRCPQLFGSNLKKNFVFDLIYDNVLNFTHKDSLFQWYNLKNIWKDINIAIKHSLPLINFAVEPLTAYELAKHVLGMEFNNVTEKLPLKYNVLTKYGSFYGSDDFYLYQKDETLEELRDFIIKERKRISK